MDCGDAEVGSVVSSPPSVSTPRSRTRASTVTSAAACTPAASAAASDILSSPRSLNRYLNQLAHAKAVCDKRLVELGCDDPYGSGSANDATYISGKGLAGETVSSTTTDTCSTDQPLTFEAVMNSTFTRRFFYAYLLEENQQDLLGLWSAVEELRKADRALWHQLATEIFYCYINKPTGAVQVGEFDQCHFMQPPAITRRVQRPSTIAGSALHSETHRVVSSWR